MLDRRTLTASVPVATLPPFSQEDVLALLGWRREAQEIVGWVKPDNFTQPEGVGPIDYRTIATEALQFWEQFKSPPADHLYDLVLQRVPDAARPQWMQILLGLQELAPRLNLAYVTDRLHRFLYQADLKSRIYQSLRSLQSGDLERAEEVLTARTGIEDRGSALSLSDTGALEQYLVQRQQDQFLSGIPDLDKWHIAPARKELYLVVAPAKRGKSWWLVHIAKFALMARARVLHITVEMRKEQTLQRYIQALTGASKRPEALHRLLRLEKNESHIVRGVHTETLEKRPGLILPGGKLDAAVVARVQALAGRMDLQIQEYPTSSLTIGQMESYLDWLERVKRFVPDMVIIDYGDKFKVDSSNLRIEIGAVFEGIRRVGQERNMAMVTATQSNRASARARVVRYDDVAEDYSKVMTADWILTLSQTEAEKSLGAARVRVTGRDEADGRTVLITQNYALGQFCLDSAILPDDWETLLSAHVPETDDGKVG